MSTDAIALPAEPSIERPQAKPLLALPRRAPVAVSGFEPRLLSGDEEFRRCLRVGLTLQLGASGAREEVSAYTSLAGFKMERYLIAEQPMARVFSRLENRELEARCVADARVLTFNTRVTSTLSSPEPLIFLAYPEQVSASSLRRFQRVRVSFPVRVVVAGGAEVSRGKVVDVSLGGMGIQLETPLAGLADAASVRLDVELPSGPSRFDGVVRRLRDDSSFVGVELSLGEGAEARRALLAQVMRERALEDQNTLADETYL